MSDHGAKNDSHGHAHDHGPEIEKHSHHSHSHADAPSWLLVLGFVFNFSIFVVGMIVWQKSSSVAILADSLHDFLHCIIYAVAIWGNAAYNQRRQAYASLWIGIIITSTALFIGTLGIVKSIRPDEAISTYMLIIASFNLASELLIAGLMLSVKHNEIQIRKIFLIRRILRDVVVDGLGSFGVLIAGILVLTVQYYRADGLAAIAIACIALVFGIATIVDARNELHEDDSSHEEHLHEH